MFQCVFFLGLMALGYSGPVVPESNTVNYLDLIDAVESTPVGPLDKECAEQFRLVLNDFKNTSRDYLVIYKSEPTLSTRKQDYFVCLALKRGLLDEYGNITKQHKNNTQRDLRSLGLFDESVLNAVKTDCPVAYDPKDDEDFSLPSLYHNYSTCLYEKIHGFYERLGNPYLNESASESDDDIDTSIKKMFSMESYDRTDKAMMKFLHITPKA